ncbi:hypothetical protein Moror_9864 [Moniliophthora roreri MCA 2997]|uniref:Uncharacterized protein n=1 Tax=Moniliophthora roreri (strain MCA 2997) TaxID=1381753 RepID=V2WI02_MONRO|nr:hypothetical protein Moror_9864 [Moniliophthora roreri MCA 2997]
MSSQSELEKTVAPFLDPQFAVTLPLNTMIATFLVYGIYIVIFSICVSIFRNSNQDPENDRRNKLYVWSTFLSFGLATILIAFYTWDYYDQAVVLHDTIRSRDYRALLERLAHDNAKVVRRGIISSTRALICLITDFTVVI